MYRTYNRIFMEWARSESVHRVSKQVVKDFIRYYRAAFGAGKGAASDNTMKSVVKALRYRFVQCEDHPISMIPPWKGSTQVN